MSFNCPMCDQPLYNRKRATCEACGAVLKPGVVFFDELLPPEALDRAFEFAREAALLLVVGTSLEVWPVAVLGPTSMK